MKIFFINKKTLYLFSLIILLIIILLGLSIRHKMTKEVMYEEPYYQGLREEKIVAFACNIDWGAEYISDMLKIFKLNDIKITFFPTGKWAEQNREILKLIDDNGHEIGNHGYSHIDYDKLDYKQNHLEIKKADDIIREMIKQEVKYFAPPSGSFNKYTLEAAKELNYKTILWSIDTIDWREDSTKDIIIERIEGKLHNSGIILMHPTKAINEALPELIRYILESGYKIGRISDIL